MSEPAPPAYIVHDYCAVCGERLQVSPVHGARIACHPDAERHRGQASQMYWSEAAPLPEDVRGLHQLTGRDLQVQTEYFDRDTGWRVSHPPLYLYRSPA